MFSSFSFRYSLWVLVLIIFAGFFITAGCDKDDSLTVGSISGVITFYGEIPETGDLFISLRKSDDVTGSESEIQDIEDNTATFKLSDLEMDTYTLSAIWTDSEEKYTVGTYADNIVLTKGNRDFTGADFQASFEQLTLNKAATYLQNMQNTDGGFPFRVEISLDSDFETTTWATRGLIMMGNSVESDMIRSAVNYILERQTEDGNFNEVNTAHTGFALLALLDADVSGVETDTAVTWLKNAQLADGSWGMGLEGQGLTLYTGVAMTALSAAGMSSSDPVMTKAIAFCETSQNDDGGWAMVAGDSWSMMTSWLMQGLLSAGVSKDSDMIRNAHAFVLSCQNEDGGFGQVVTALSDPELTAHAVLGLAEIDGYSPELQNASEYLRSVQEDDGSYISATPVEIEEPEKNLQTTSFVVWALHTFSETVKYNLSK